MRKPGLVQHGLADRVRHHARRLARLRRAAPPRSMLAITAGALRRVRADQSRAISGRSNASTGRALANTSATWSSDLMTLIGDVLHRRSRTGRQSAANAGPVPARRPPSLRGDLAADSGRVAHGQGQRRPGAHQMWIAPPSTASAASLTASLKVGWAWQIRPTSSLLAPNSMAVTNSAISVPASGPMICAPSTKSVCLVRQHLHEPVRHVHRPGAAIGGEGGTCPPRYSMPAAFSSSSVAPTDGHFRPGINHARNGVVVHMARLPGDDLGHGHAPHPPPYGPASAPLITSPIAYTPGTLVAKCASVLMRFLSSSSTPCRFQAQAPHNKRAGQSTAAPHPP